MKKTILCLGLLVAAVAAFADSTTPRFGATNPSVGSAGWATKIINNNNIFDNAGGLNISNPWTNLNTWTSTASFQNYVEWKSTDNTTTILQIAGNNAVGSSYPVLFTNAFLKFAGNNMGGNPGDYYLARGNSAMTINAPTGARVDLLVNNVGIVNVNGNGLGINNTNAQSKLDIVGTGPSYAMSLSTSSSSGPFNFRVTNSGDTILGDVKLSPGLTTAGPGGNAFNGGIITQGVFDGGNYQVSSYQLAPTAGTLPAWGPITENVWQGTADQTTNLNRFSATEMAAFADQGLTDAANDIRLQEECSGSVLCRPIKLTMQQNSSGAQVQYIVANTTFTVASTTNSIGDLLIFPRTDSPSPTGNNLRMAIGTMRRGTSAALTGSGTQDSPKLEMFGDSYDTSMHTARWQEYVAVTSNAGASTYHRQSAIDNGSFTDRMTLTDAGVLAATTFSGSGASLTNLPAGQLTGVAAIANGGTNSSTALSGSSIMVSNGSAIIQGSAGTSTQVLHGNASGTPTYSSVVNADLSAGAFSNITGVGVIGTASSQLVNDQVGSARTFIAASADATTTIGGSSVAVVIANTGTTTSNTEALIFGAITGANTTIFGNAEIVAINGARTNGQYPTGQLAFLTSTSLNSAPTEKMRLDNSGNLGLGVTGPSAQLHTSGSVRFANFGAGAATFDASGNISSVSDERLKDVQGPFAYGLKELLQVKPIAYKWNAKSGMDTVNTYHGFSAQNLKNAMPDIVFLGKNGYYSFEDRGVAAALVNAIQTLSAKCDALQAQVDALKAAKK